MVVDLVLSTDWRDLYDNPEALRGELSGIWGTLNLEEDTWLVFAPGGELAAVAELLVRGARCEVEAAVRPRYAGRGIGGWIVDQTESAVKRRVLAMPPGERVTLAYPANSKNEAARGLLEDRGYPATRRFLDHGDGPRR